MRYGQTACMIRFKKYITYHTLWTSKPTAGRASANMRTEQEKENSINSTEPENEKPLYSLTYWVSELWTVNIERIANVMHDSFIVMQFDFIRFEYVVGLGDCLYTNSIFHLDLFVVDSNFDYLLYLLAYNNIP